MGVLCKWALVPETSHINTEITIFQRSVVYLPCRSNNRLYLLAVNQTIEICIVHHWSWEAVKNKGKSC